MWEGERAAASHTRGRHGQIGKATSLARSVECKLRQGTVCAAKQQAAAGSISSAAARLPELSRLSVTRAQRHADVRRAACSVTCLPDAPGSRRSCPPPRWAPPPCTAPPPPHSSPARRWPPLHDKEGRGTALWAEGIGRRGEAWHKADRLARGHHCSSRAGRAESTGRPGTAG